MRIPTELVKLKLFCEEVKLKFGLKLIGRMLQCMTQSKERVKMQSILLTNAAGREISSKRVIPQDKFYDRKLLINAKIRASSYV